MLSTLLLTKVQELKTDIAIKAATECNDISGVDCSSDTIIAYNTKLDEIATLIEQYYSPAHFETRERRLNELIMTTYQTEVLRGMSTSGEGSDFIFPEEATAPVGYNDFSILFSMKPFSDIFLASTSESIWDNCVCNPSFVALEKLEALRVQAEDAIPAEDAQISALLYWLRAFSSHNASITLFENVTASGTRLSKREIGEDIFINKKAKDIIEYFNLNIRIPSYI